MKLYWCERTRAVRAVWMMEELGVPYERVRIDIRDEQSRAHPAFRAASPMGKVPALEDGAVRIWDSGAICAYLADQYPAAKLAPPIGSPDRGAYLMWLMYTNSVIEPAMGEKAGGLKPNSVTYGWGGWDQMLTVMRTDDSPARCHSPAAAHAVLSTQSPMGPISPVSSAMGMNRPGLTEPCTGCSHRSSASTPTIRPDDMSTCGW